MNPSDRVRILHMINAAEEALSFVENIKQTDFSKNRILIFSVIKEVEIIGEAASKVSKEIMDANPEIPWKDIVGMRNRLIHGYFDVDIELVWNTLQYNIPPLIELLRPIIEE